MGKELYLERGARLVEEPKSCFGGELLEKSGSYEAFENTALYYHKWLLCKSTSIILCW